MTRIQLLPVVSSLSALALGHIVAADWDAIVNVISATCAFPFDEANYLLWKSLIQHPPKPSCSIFIDVLPFSVAPLYEIVLSRKLLWVNWLTEHSAKDLCTCFFLHKHRCSLVKECHLKLGANVANSIKCSASQTTAAFRDPPGNRGISIPASTLLWFDRWAY